MAMERFTSGADAPFRFSVEIHGEGEGRTLTVAGSAAASDHELIRRYRIGGASQAHWLDFFAEVARDFGTRMPRNREPAPPPAFASPCRPLLTENVGSGILSGYGDPAVIRCPGDGGAGDSYYLFATSNDAPDSFPILRSGDLERWQHVGFAFPRGRKLAWAADGAGVGDFWAPELHRVGDRFLLCFSARARDGSLAIGIASADRPEGPFAAPEEPLLGGGVIDAHLLVRSEGEPLLFWKEDRNGVWPALLCGLLGRDPGLVPGLFPDAADARTAALALALWPWARRQRQMERFFLLQPLIEAAVSRFAEVRERLAALGTAEAEALLKAMRTPIFAQPLAPDRLGLTGEPVEVLANDQEWEGHLVEGPWVTEQQGRFYLFYAGNDFSTAHYGIGAAVAESPLGPYRKLPEPLLRSSSDWSGPGHPSVAVGPDGVPRLFLHAFFPGRAGYDEFRALLSVGLAFHEDRVELLP